MLGIQFFNIHIMVDDALLYWIKGARTLEVRMPPLTPTLN